MKDRIKELRKALGLTQQQLADKLGVKQNTIAKYEIGINAPTEQTITTLCREFRVNEDWLRNGIGEMFKAQTLDEEIIAFIGDLQYSPDDDFKKEFISILARLDKEDWETLHKITRLLLDKEKERENKDK